MLHVVLAHVQVPVVLTGQIVSFWFESGDDVFEILELLDRTVGDGVTQVHHEIGRRVHRVDLLDGRLQPDFHGVIFLPHGMAVSEDREREILYSGTCNGRGREQQGRQGRCRQGGARQPQRLDESPAAPARGQRIPTAVVHIAFARDAGGENLEIRLLRIQVLPVYRFHDHLCFFSFVRLQFGAQSMGEQSV